MTRSSSSSSPWKTSTRFCELPEHVVKVTVYLTDVTDRARLNPIREEYFGDHRPASTLVEVSALVSPRMKVEIEAEAVIP